jgi:hypothetical protein
MDLQIMGRVVVEEFARNKEAATQNLAVLKAAFDGQMIF